MSTSIFEAEEFLSDISSSDESEDSTSEPSSPAVKLPAELLEFADVFQEASANKLPAHRPYDCAIDLLPGQEPPYCQIYSLSPDEDKLVQEYIEENLKKGFIRKSMSSAGASIFFVNKDRDAKGKGKPSQKRLVVNYQGLDRVTQKFRYPLPRIDDLFDYLRGAKIFSKIDLRSAYHLLRIREGDEWKTAFRTKYGLFEYQVMPFGLSNAPAYFQRFINETFKEMIGKFVVIYLDDFLIYSKDESSHREHIRAVLEGLREAHLYAKLEKCQFGVPSVKFLGCQVSANGFSINPDRVKAVMEWPTPRNRKELQKFLGFANFPRKFVENYSQITVPLHRLTRKNVSYSWTPECESAFNALKLAISSAPVLAHPDPDKPFVVETDASDFAIGCVLSQEDSDGDLRPCAFYSRGLKPAERNYPIYEKELLAIKVALEEWRHYLEGSPHQFTVLSDHKGLEFFANAKVINQRHARWAIFFKRFDFVVRYRPGSLNNLADALSRRPDYVPTGTELYQTPQPILEPSSIEIAAISSSSAASFIEQVKQALPHDAYFQNHVTDSQGNSQFRIVDNLAYLQERLYVPEGPLRLQALANCHDAKLAGHYGQRKTSELVNRKFYWPGMASMIKDYCDSCWTCAQAKTPRHLPHGPLMPLPIPDRPWSCVAMDFLTDLPVSGGFSTILVVVDRFSKMSHFIPAQGLPNAEETAELFMKEIVKLHGIPDEVVSDRGSQFVSRFWKRFLELIGTKQCLSTAYHPQTDGQSERTIQVLQQYLRCFISYHQDDWISLLPLAEFSFNNTMNASTKMTPFFINSGLNPRFELITPPETKVPSVEHRLDILRSTHEELKINLMKAQEDHEKFANRQRKESQDLKPGDQVWLSTQNITTNRPSKKLDSKRLGPFPVKKIINKHAIELDLPPWMQIHPVFHESLLERVKINELSKRHQEGPPPVVVNDQEEYLVKEILDSRYKGKHFEYLIDWEGYPPSERCWVNANNVHAPVKVREFHLRYPSKPHTPEFLGGGVLKGG